MCTDGTPLERPCPILSTRIVGEAPYSNRRQVYARGRKESALECAGEGHIDGRGNRLRGNRKARVEGSFVKFDIDGRGVGAGVDEEGASGCVSPKVLRVESKEGEIGINISPLRGYRNRSRLVGVCWDSIEHRDVGYNGSSGGLERQKIGNREVSNDVPLQRLEFRFLNLDILLACVRVLDGFNLVQKPTAAMRNPFLELTDNNRGLRLISSKLTCISGTETTIRSISKP